MITGQIAKRDFFYYLNSEQGNYLLVYREDDLSTKIDDSMLGAIINADIDESEKSKEAFAGIDILREKHSDLDLKGNVLIHAK
ncbi:MAG: hypothetical protein AB1861_03375 [Cyanobacteriota bacterium]